MATWNELFLNKKFIMEFPQTEVYKFAKKLDKVFIEQPLNIWDLCCGAGRHTVFLSKMGYSVYSSDISENGINHLQTWLNKEKLTATLCVKDMTEDPWKNVKFHGIICWDALHHNTIENIRKAEEIVYERTLPNGLFMLTLLSTKAGIHTKGKEIEKNTYVEEDGAEAGVPHHYFNLDEIKVIYKKWNFLILEEQVANYIETEPDFYITNPFSYTKWNLLLKKQG
jgi:SAM-dependent methyltransferase